MRNWFCKVEPDRQAMDQQPDISSALPDHLGREMTSAADPALGTGKAVATIGACFESSYARCLPAPFVRLAGVWFEAPGGRATAIFLASFVLAWTLFQVLSY